MKASRDILLVTGLSGAGKSTVLKTLEDIGWEVVDNLPLMLLDRLLDAPPPAAAVGGSQPLALGLGSRTRDFDPGAVATRLTAWQQAHDEAIATLFLDCAGSELERRYAETRRRHPLAVDRPASDGIARERGFLRPLRDVADQLVDTTSMSANELAALIRTSFARNDAAEPVLSLSSFGFARGLPRDADLVFDMRFLRNPHWVPALKPGTGLDPEVAAYVAADPAYEPAVSRIEELLALLIPRYRAEGKAYVSVAIGCTGGRHRSVHVAERIGSFLRARGFSPTVSHRDLRATPQDPLEGPPATS
ncbi:RNase adapter RapZ [Sphingomonas rubra]|uniref:UPF0042 nucleotide-binding protein n=1 Tax=Sphingomonas rubra TaxID=634430 RepID=A0A1I5PVW6_9SPHN|nr:RNase adapter RapZ [Sphingomonas rubra]SFP38104.1 UPF0042 nucleotide-binding protein [Sphingomonas rubra]